MKTNDYYFAGDVSMDDMHMLGRLDKGQYVIATSDITFTMDDVTITARIGDMIINTGNGLNIIGFLPKVE